ncbi:MAG: hypothetical protein V7K61_30935 [Nostoc sp.]
MQSLIELVLASRREGGDFRDTLNPPNLSKQFRLCLTIANLDPENMAD